MILCVYIPPCVGGHYLYSLYETEHLPTSASVGLERMETVPVQVFKQVELLSDGRLGRRNSRSDRETHGQKGLNQRWGGYRQELALIISQASHLSEPVYFMRDTAGEYHLTYPATVITTKKLYI